MSSKQALKAHQHLTSGISPAERITLNVPPKAPTEGSQDDLILRAFERGNGAGLLHLGVSLANAELEPSLGFWRDLARAQLSDLCARLQPGSPSAAELLPLDPASRQRLTASVPPMPGAEWVSGELLQRLSAQLNAEIEARAAEHTDGFEGYLEAQHSELHVAGRVCLHLAENPQATALPFAFIATYARRIPGSPDWLHVPLNRALQEYAGHGNKQLLLALLTPLQRAAQQSAVVRELIDSGHIYHPLAWSKEEAFDFLEESQGFEHAGLSLALPAWWRLETEAGPSVDVTLGQAQPAQLGLEGLLDFQIELTLGGQSLSPEEIEELLRGEAGLLLLRGRWIHHDPKALRRCLAQWEQRKLESNPAGLPLGAAMRLLAGVEPSPHSHGAKPPQRNWSQVHAGHWLDAQLDALRDPSISQAIERHAGLHAELRPYQMLGVQWLWTLHGLGLGGCLADDMGLGKTIQVIALLSLLHGHQEERPGPRDLLIVPASLLTNWSEELARFAPHLRAFIAHPSSLPSRKLKALDPAELKSYDLVISSYGTATRTPWIGERRWRCLVLDEAQAIKNPGAKQTRAIKQLDSQWRLALTGTPVENKLDDLWSLFDFLNPGLLGAASNFKALSRSMSEGKGDGYRPLRKLVSPYILRRMKTDKSIISDLPDKTEMTTHCLLSREQAALYKESVQELKRSLKGAEGMQRRGLVLAFLMRFKQICNHPSHWLKDGSYAPEASGKFQRIAELCASISARQEKLLVFSQFAQLTGPLQQHLEACFGKPGLVLHGGTPIKSRQKRVQQFQQDEGLPFMVLSLKAGGTGLNLTAANHVIHFDRWWNPAVENQATDRAFRIGQKRNVLVHKFVCKGTVEERIDRLIKGKQQLSDEVLKGNAEQELTELSNEELIELVSLDLQSAVSQ